MSRALVNLTGGLTFDKFAKYLCLWGPGTGQRGFHSTAATAKWEREGACRAVRARLKYASSIWMSQDGKYGALCSSY